jgi:tetratricopeptide (TPR) repeat protein
MRRTAIYCCILVLFTALTACKSMERAESIRRMNEGLEAVDRGATLDSVRLLKEASQTDPTYADPPYYLAQIYHMKLSEPKNAERFYREALDRDETNPQIAYRLGMVLTDQAQWEDAMGHFRQAVTNKKDFAKAWFRLGLVQEKLRQHAEAVESYGSAIRNDARMKMDKEDPGGAAYHALGDLYVRFGFHDKALQVYENGIQNNTYDADGDGTDENKVPQLLTGKGVALLKLARYPEAEGVLKQSLELDPSQTAATFNLAVAHHAQTRSPEAVSLLENFLKRADRVEDSARIVAAQGLLQQIQESLEKSAGK